MDRLDSWLNRQTGWRRAAVLWVVLCPLAVGLGSSLWPGTAFGEVAALSVLATVPFAGLAAVAQLRWQARNPQKPQQSWRMCVAMWCLAGSVLLGTLTDRPLGRPLPASCEPVVVSRALSVACSQHPDHIHHVVWLVQLALLAGAVVFWLLAVRRSSKIRRNGWSAGSPASAWPRRTNGL